MVYALMFPCSKKLCLQKHIFIYIQVEDRAVTTVVLKSSCNYCAIFSQFLGGLEHTCGTDAQKSVDRRRIRTDDHQPYKPQAGALTN